MDADASFHDYYADLNLQLGAPPTSIKAAYNTLVLLTHPDKTGNPDSTAFRVVQEAYKKLSDDEFRTAYDKNYWRRKLHTDPPGTENYTRTAEYEAEEQRRRARSPPPKQPAQKYNEPSYKYFFGKSYLGWQKRMAAWRARHPEWAENEKQSKAEEAFTTPDPFAHGLAVKMLEHPCVQERCKCRVQDWRVQPGTDFCVFCMTSHTGGSRCPGCEALACKKCLEKIVGLERTAFGGLGSKAQYRSSGG